jgi:hypothetical protein
MSSKTKTTDTKEEGKPALVPKLRFPEFRNAGGGRQARLLEQVDVKLFARSKGISRRAQLSSYGEGRAFDIRTSCTHDIGETDKGR